MFTVKYKFTKRKEKYNNEPKSQASVIVHFLKIVFIDGFWEREKEGGREERFVVPLTYASLVDFCMCLA